MDPSVRSASVSACARVRASWEAGVAPAVAELVGVDALVVDAEERWERWEPATLEYYVGAMPGLMRDGEACRAVLMCEAARRGGEAGEALAREVEGRVPPLRTEIGELAALLALMRSGEEDELAPGRRLGKYELCEVLGRGGFGVVGRALDVELRRYVALKLLARDGKGAGRMIAEARAAAALGHEHIVQVHAAGEFEDEGLAYIDSQLAGDAAPTAEDPLAVAVARPLEAVGVGGAREAARIVEEACRGIAAAHARG